MQVMAAASLVLLILAGLVFIWLGETLDRFLPFREVGTRTAIVLAASQWSS